MNPTTKVDKAVCWCATCGTSTTDDRDYAATHNAQTGHPTAIRQWTVTTYPEVQPDATP